MTVRELILRLAEIASVQGDDMEVVAVPEGGLGLERWVLDAGLSSGAEPRVVMRLTLGDAVEP